MNWTEATNSQLFAIAFHDDGTTGLHVSGAIEEIKRRYRIRHRRVNYHLRAVYPR
jgi:hypothetical protein